MPAYVVRCCCGANARFETASTDAYTHGKVVDQYSRWMTQHDGCPALYVPKNPNPAGPLCGSVTTTVANNEAPVLENVGASGLVGLGPDSPPPKDTSNG